MKDLAQMSGKRASDEPALSLDVLGPLFMD